MCALYVPRQLILHPAISHRFAKRIQELPRAVCLVGAQETVNDCPRFRRRVTS